MIRPYTSINMPLWSKVLVCNACHPCLLQYDSFHLNPFKTNMWQLSTHHTSRHLRKVPKVQQSTRLFSSVKAAWIKGFTMHYGTLLAQWMSLQLKSISKRGPWLKWAILTVTGFLHILHSKPCKVCFLFLFFSLSLLGTLVGFVGLGNGANWVTENVPTGQSGKRELSVWLETRGCFADVLHILGTFVDVCDGSVWARLWIKVIC